MSAALSLMTFSSRGAYLKRPFPFSPPFSLFSSLSPCGPPLSPPAPTPFPTLPISFFPFFFVFILSHPQFTGKESFGRERGGAEKEGLTRPDPRESKLGPHERFVRNFGQVCEALQTQIRGGGWREGGSAGWQALAPKRRRRRRHRSNGRLGLPPPQHVAAAASCRTCPRTHPTWPRPLPRASPPASSWPST